MSVVPSAGLGASATVLVRGAVRKVTKVDTGVVKDWFDDDEVKVAPDNPDDEAHESDNDRDVGHGSDGREKNLCATRGDIFLRIIKISTSHRREC
jgi:hypothetical protein